MNETTPTDEIVSQGDGTFKIKMPFSKFNITFRLLNGEDETYLAKASTLKKKNYSMDSYWVANKSGWSIIVIVKINLNLFYLG